MQPGLFDGTEFQQPRYTIDCCSFVLLDSYSPDKRFKVFSGVRCLINEARLRTVAILLDEVKEYAPISYKQLAEHRGTIAVDEVDLYPHVGAMARKYPRISGRGLARPRGEKADPWLLTLAKQQRLILVTEESRRPGEMKLPYACGKEGVECLNLQELIDKEGWLSDKSPGTLKS